MFEQFRFFLNLYFLIMAISQFIPAVRIGYLYTYWGPLAFVLAVTLFREGRFLVLFFQLLVQNV